jgi:hypothetical protein
MSWCYISVLCIMAVLDSSVTEVDLTKTYKQYIEFIAL